MIHTRITLTICALWLSIWYPSWATRNLSLSLFYRASWMSCIATMWMSCRILPRLHGQCHWNSRPTLQHRHRYAYCIVLLLVQVFVVHWILVAERSLVSKETSKRCPTHGEYRIWYETRCHVILCEWLGSLWFDIYRGRTTSSCSWILCFVSSSHDDASLALI